LTFGFVNLNLDLRLFFADWAFIGTGTVEEVVVVCSPVLILGLQTFRIIESI